MAPRTSNHGTAPVDEQRHPLHREGDSANYMINSNPHFTSKQLVDPGAVVLGIGGGVGPSAGVGLHQKIIDNTRSTTDQGHFTVVHVSRSAHVQDRTKFLLGEIKTNPGVGMAEAVWAIASAAKTNGEVAVVTVPCNTFHAPPVWQAYVNHLAQLGADGSALRLIHMLDESALPRALPPSRPRSDANGGPQR